MTGTKRAQHCTAGDQLPADPVAAQVDPSESGETRGSEEADPAQVEDECARNADVTFDVAGHVDAVAGVNLAADRNHDQIRSDCCARSCPAPLLDFTEMNRIRSVEAARTDGRHHDLLGIEVRG
ncbi:MAG TPA: hypothetical protein VGO30_02525 [Mycobacterium sp.]|nr:hypothetical protein [Mycobacterium sp.]